MLSNRFPEISKDLQRTNKAIVAIGCSFVQGAEMTPLNKAVDLDSYKNSNTFVNKLCEVFLKGEYTPINFGQEAAGNFAAISRLHLYNIPWRSLDELIVIYMPTGMQRFDIIRDDNEVLLGQEFKTVWPYTSMPAKDDFTMIGRMFERTCHSEKFEVLNCILNFQILNSWVTANNAKLMVFPAFSKEYSRDYFLKCLDTKVFRDSASQLIVNKDSNQLQPFDYSFLVDQVPWEKFLTIDDSVNFFDLCYKNDAKYNPALSMHDVLRFNALANNKWIKPRGHPSELGHQLLAKKLFEIITAV